MTYNLDRATETHKRMIEKSTAKYHMELDRIRELENTQEVYLTGAAECRNWLWQPVIRIAYTTDQNKNEHVVEINMETDKIEKVD